MLSVRTFGGVLIGDNRDGGRERRDRSVSNDVLSRTDCESSEDCFIYTVFVPVGVVVMSGVGNVGSFVTGCIGEGI